MAAAATWVQRVSVSSRHDLDAGGQLVAADERSSHRVLVALDAETAHLASVQHAAWMTLNQLVRLSGVIEKVGLACPPSVPLAGRIVPLAPRSGDLAGALMTGCAEIGIVPVTACVPESKEFSRSLLLGPGDARGCTRVHGEGWWGGFSSDGIVDVDESDPNPIGPYIAASLVVGELFRSAGLKEYEAVDDLFLSAWTLRPTAAPDFIGPRLGEVRVDCLLAGVGAVGSMVVHALWALAQAGGGVVLCDNDKAGVDETNLNRYVLFGRSSIGSPKASAAAEIASDAGVDFSPVDGPIETLERFPERVVSAVDINTAREAIQARYPARILSGATRDLRAEVLRVAAPGEGACLRCYNPPENRPSDEALRAAVDSGTYGTLEELAAVHGVTADEIQAWVARGECGRASERLLPWLRDDLGTPPQFAVSFASSLAGVLLAAELLKDVSSEVGPLDDKRNRAVFQFGMPLGRANQPAPYSSDPECPLCGPAGNRIALDTWRTRAEALHPRRLPQD